MTWYFGAMFEAGEEDGDEPPGYSPNGLCPMCGCEMESDIQDATMLEDGTWFNAVTITEFCPCCDYSQVSYEA